MKKIFIAFKFKNEDQKELGKILEGICNTLNTSGHTNYCSFWDAKMFEEKKFSSRQITEHALKELDKSDVFLAFVMSEEISEGMLVEAGYAIAKNKKIILLIHKNAKSHKLRRLFDNKEIIEFLNLEDIKNKLTKLKI